MPSQPARDKGCGTQRLDTHNAACGIETLTTYTTQVNAIVSTHTMLRAALKLDLGKNRKTSETLVSTHTMLRAALKP